MWSNIARVSLRHNNDLSHRLLRCSPPPFSAGSPRGILTYCGLPHPSYTFDYDNGGNEADTYSLPCVFQDKYGAPLPLPFKPDERMMKKQAKQLSAGAGREAEEDNEGKQLNMKEDDEALYFKMDMPGVGKEDAKVYLEGSTLMVKGIRKLDSQFDDDEDDEEMKRSNSNKTTYVAGVSIKPMHQYKISGIKAEMKNGVLKVTVPKVKDEERTDVLHVQID